MEDSNVLAEANRQLDRVLGFFPRVDSKASTLFAMNTGVLAVASLNARPTDFAAWYLAVPGAIGLLLTSAAIYFVYRCMFPHLDGGQASLIYFREIAQRTESNFVSQFASRSENDHTNDILGQVWRNAEILKLKFDAVRLAFLSLVLSLVPWTIYLVAASVTRAQVPALN